MSQASGTVSAEILERIVRRVVEVAEPEKIILFGSAAAGRHGPNSDIDLLVVKRGANRLELADKIYRNLHGVGEPVDIIVVTPDDIEKHRHTHALVIAPALKEGTVLYGASEKTT